MKAYSIVLTGQGDTQIYIVDKEVWDWVNSPISGKPDGHVSSWVDQLVPQKVIDYHRKEEQKLADFNNRQPEFCDILITAGSWDNDRALNAIPITIDGEEALFFSVKELANFCREHDIEIVDSYEGYIY